MKYTASVVLITVFGLTGCVTAKPMTTPNGQQGFHIDCGGGGVDWSDCYQEAAKQCKGPYGIVDRTGNSTFTPYGPIVTRELMVECRN